MLKRLDLITGLSLARVALGAGAFLAPGPTLKALTLDVEGSPQLSYLSRVAGARDIGIGVATLLSRGRARRFMVGTGIAVDSADALSAALSLGSGALTRGRALYLALPAVAAAGVGIAGLVEELRGGHREA